MKVTVSVKPNSRIEKIDKITESEYVIRVNAPPADGKANERVIDLLSKYFMRPKSCIELVTGEKSKKKVFIIS